MWNIRSVVENKLQVLSVLMFVGLALLHVRQYTSKVNLENKLDDVVIVMVNGKDAGTGFFFNNSGCIMTAFHVVAPKDPGKLNELHVKLRGEPKHYKAFAHAGNGNLDIAIICSTEVTRPGLRIVSTEGIKQGDKVWAIGHPAGRTWNLTNGVVSRLSYKMHEYNGAWMPRFDIFTTAFIAWGNSGGPLINENGDVVGMIVEWDNPGIPYPNSINIAVPGTDLLRYTKSIWGK